MKYQHLSIEEREIIQQGLWQGDSLRMIGACVGRSAATISRELRRNSSPEKHQYMSRRANERALLKRKSRGRIERLKTVEIRSYVIENIRKRWSPEQIAGRLRKET